MITDLLGAGTCHHVFVTFTLIKNKIFKSHLVISKFGILTSKTFNTAWEQQLTIISNVVFQFFTTFMFVGVFFMYLVYMLNIDVWEPVV